MGIKPKEIFVRLGTDNIPIDTIVEYRLDKNIETIEQREKRKKVDASNAGFGASLLGGFASAPAAAIAAVFSTTGLPAIAVLGGGLVAGSVIGRKRSNKKFEEQPQNQTLDHSKLVVTYEEGRQQIFCADTSTFNIYEAYQELNAKFPKAKRLREIKSKIRHNNSGEEEVEYAIKWFLADTKENVVSVKKDCESKYRYGCILLGSPDRIDEPQEYDHILVCNPGIILIETKHWKGKVEIRPDGKWLRSSDDSGTMTGIKSPLFQIQRHETLIKTILPHVPVFNILCFSNKSAILDGVENFTEFPIVYVDQLKDTLSKIISSANSSVNGLDYIIDKIEKNKVNRIAASEIE